MNKINIGLYSQEKTYTHSESLKICTFYAYMQYIQAANNGIYWGTLGLV